MEDMSQYPWFRAALGREEAEQLLAARADGEFVVRQDPVYPFKVALSVKMDNFVQHARLHKPTGGMWNVRDELGAVHVGATLNELLQSMDVLQMQQQAEPAVLQYDDALVQPPMQQKPVYDRAPSDQRTSHYDRVDDDIAKQAMASLGGGGSDSHYARVSVQQFKAQNDDHYAPIGL